MMVLSNFSDGQVNSEGREGGRYTGNETGRRGRYGPVQLLRWTGRRKGREGGEEKEGRGEGRSKDGAAVILPDTQGEL